MGTGCRAAGTADRVLGPCLALAVTLLAALPAAGVADGTRELLAPPLAGFATTSPVRLFRGAELYGHIDGGAEIYLELGFVEVAVAALERGGSPVDAEVYRMSDDAAALGVYLGRCGAETPAIGLAARHTVGSHQLQLIHGPIYATFETAEDSKLPASALVELAGALLARLPAAQPVDVLGLLPAEHRVPGSERVIRGPVGLSALITLGDGDILSQAGTVTAVMAEYRDRPSAPSTSLVVARYPDPAAARRALEHVKGHLDPAIRLTAGTAERLDFVDYSSRVGTVTVSGDQLELRLTPPAKP
jgi:hypothetical protein